MLELVAATPANAEDVRAFLGRDDFGGCFCAVWTAFTDAPSWVARCRDAARPNWDVTAARIAARVPVGFLVREDGETVAWTGAGPKTAFPLLATRPGSRLDPATDDVWCVGCLALREDRRDGGLSRRIVAAVIEEARRAGARAVEAYPVLPWDEGKSYRGAATTYEALGFAVIGSEPSGEARALLVRIDL